LRKLQHCDMGSGDVGEGDVVGRGATIEELKAT
jgi:hypothetical protein